MDLHDRMRAYIAAIPKVELHLHLEGAISPETILEIARRNGIELPVTSVAEARDWFVFRDFYHFNRVYNAITACLKTSDDYAFIVTELGTELARQNVKYAEVSFSPSGARWLGQVNERVYMDGLSRGRRRVMDDHGIELNWIFDLTRDSRRFAELADYATQVAIDGRQDGVIGIGLGGYDQYGPPEEFSKWFDMGLAAGLRSYPHAGEFAGPENIWGALQALQAERIGHGIRAVDDDELVDYLVGNRIPLDVCPTSNWRLGAVPNEGEHPLKAMHRRGVMVTVNSDDPSLFNTTLTEEICLLTTRVGLDLADVDAIVQNGIDACFLDQDEKARLRAEFQEQSQRLKNELALRHSD
jgi:aminodeoxyfutalosine deaminase